jgi:PcfJ-like protein
MRKVATHINPATGEPCNCGFGKYSDPIDHGLEKTAGSKLNWIRDREDKFFKTEEGQRAFKQLEVLVNRNENIDPLAPWLWREIKKGRLKVTPRLLDPTQPDNLSHIADWYASNSPTRRGVDIMQLNWEQATDKVKEWDEELQSQMDEQQAAGGTVVADAGDGWTIRQITNGEEAKAEGNAMGHCVGGYGQAIESGQTLIYSLRDDKNQPHVTIEISPAENEYNQKIRDEIRARIKARSVIENYIREDLKEIEGKENLEQRLEDFAHHYRVDSDLLKAAYLEYKYGKEMEPLPPLSPAGGNVIQIQGKGNTVPIEEYQEPVGNWLMNMEDGPVTSTQERQTLIVPSPSSVDELLYWINPYDDPYYDSKTVKISEPQSWHDYFPDEYGEYDEDNEEIGEITEENWEAIIGDLILNPRAMQDILYTAEYVGNTNIVDELLAKVDKYAQEKAYPVFTNYYYDSNSGESIAEQWERYPEGQAINYILNRNFANEQFAYIPRTIFNDISEKQNELFGIGENAKAQELIDLALATPDKFNDTPEKIKELERGLRRGLPVDRMVPWNDPRNYHYQEGRFGKRFRNWLKRKTNILDPISDQLDPTVWDDAISPRPALKPEISDWITKFITSALARNGYTHMEDWLSLVLTGSLTTYQYSPVSDCDISLFVNAEMFPEWSRAEMIGIMMEECDGVRVPGTSHPLQCYVVPQDFTREDLYKPGLRSAYDLSDRSWVVAPEKSRSHDVVREMNEAHTIALENCDKMEKLIRYEPFKAIQFYDQVHRRRKRDMEAGMGDFAPSNISYKMMAERGLERQVQNLITQYSVD